MKTKDTIILTAMFVIFVFASVIAAFISGITVVYFFLWFLAGALAYFTSRNKLSNFELVIFLFIAFGFVIVETLLKVFADNQVLDETLINRFEHILFAFSAGIILYPLLKADIKKLTFFYAQILFVIGIINLLGIGNEIFEYIFREVTDKEKIIYYEDTIYDLGMNLVGSVISALLIFLISKTSPDKKIDDSSEEEVDPAVDLNGEIEAEDYEN